MCQYLRPWRMGQKFELHALKFYQCPAPLVGPLLSQPARLEIQAGGAPSLSQEIICIMFLGYVSPV